MSINDIVLNFRGFLVASWPSLSEVLRDLDWDDDPYFIDRWAQANWELLVESQIGDGNYITPYGFNPSPETRYLNKGTAATHRIVCKPANVNAENVYWFRCFTSSDGDGGYKTAPPFDFVDVKLTTSRELLVLPLKDLRFEIQLIE